MLVGCPPPGPALLGGTGPCKQRREGADACTCLQRSGSQRTLLQGHPDGGDQPAKGPDAAADRKGLVAGGGEVGRLSEDPRLMRASKRRVLC